MESAQPRGVQEQVSAITEMLNGSEPEEVRDDEPVVEAEEVEPEQEALGESLEEGADEAGDQGEQAEVVQEAAGEIETVADFAKAAGWEPEDLYALKVRLDNGEEIPLGQMKDALQMASRERAEIAAAKEQIVQYQQRLQQQEMQMVQGRQQMSQAVEEAQSRVIAAQERYNAVEWEQLAQTDPGRAALLQQQIAAEYAGAKRDFEQAMGQQSAIQQQVMARMVQQNNERFIQAVPEWRDPVVAQRESAALDQFLVQQVGFAPEELSTVIDARARVVALMALRWYEHASSVQKTVKAVRNAPKPVVTPGGQRQAPTKVRQMNSLLQKAKTTQKRGDQIAAVNALLNPR